MKKENKRKTCLIAGLSTGLLIARRASTSRPYERARTAINDCTRRSSISHIPFFFYLPIYSSIIILPSHFFLKKKKKKIFFFKYPPNFLVFFSLTNRFFHLFLLSLSLCVVTSVSVLLLGRPLPFSISVHCATIDLSLIL